MMKCLIVLCLVLAVPAPVLRGAAPQVGETPAPLAVEGVLNGPSAKQVTWDALRGKVVVLEFWGTWCGSCVAAIPHLNALADQFKDKPVQFIAVTDEPADVVGPFLAKTPIHAWVGLDTDKSILEAFDIVSVPTTVLVDPAGRIDTITKPESVTPEVLNKLLAGQPSGLSERLRPGQFPGSGPGDPATARPLFDVRIRPAANSGGSWKLVQGVAGGRAEAGRLFGLTAMGMTVHDLIRFAYNVPPDRIIVNCQLPEGRYDAVATVPLDARDRVPSLLGRSVEVTFDLSSRFENREADVYILTSAEHLGGPALTPPTLAGNSYGYGPGWIDGLNVTANFATAFEVALGRPVVAEAIPTDVRFDVHFKYDADAGPDAIVRAAREQLGLVLTRARRSVQFLVIDASPVPAATQPAAPGE